MRCGGGCDVRDETHAGAELLVQLELVRGPCPVFSVL